MKLSLLLLLTFFNGAVFAQYWNQIANFPGSARDDGAVFVLNGKAYCGTGRNAGFATTSDFYTFDLGTEQWQSGPSMPDSAARQYASAVALSGYGYIFGGINEQGDYLNDLWQLDPWLGTWSHIDSAPFAGRCGAQSFAIGDTLYIVGGKNDQVAAYSEVWGYDVTTGQWSQRSDMPGDGIWRGFGVANASTAVVGMGIDGHNNKRGEIYFYNPTIDQWTEMFALETVPMSYPGASVRDHQVFVFGGEDELGAYSTAFRYIDLNDSTWHTLNYFPNTPRKGGMVFNSSSDFFVTTGIKPTGRTAETWVARQAVTLPEQEHNDSNFLFQTGDKLKTNETVTSIVLTNVLGQSWILENYVSGWFKLPANLAPGIYYCVLREGDSETRKSIRLDRY